MEITTETTATDVCDAFSVATPIGDFAQAIDRVWRLSELARTATVMLKAEIHLAREQGASWSEIGQALGISRQAAHERFGRSTDVD